MKGFIKIYDCILYKEDFILLPGDEIVKETSEYQTFDSISLKARLV